MMLGMEETLYPFISYGKGVGLDNCTGETAKTARHTGLIPLQQTLNIFSDKHPLSHHTFSGKNGSIFSPDCNFSACCRPPVTLHVLKWELKYHTSKVLHNHVE